MQFPKTFLWIVLILVIFSGYVFYKNLTLQQGKTDSKPTTVEVTGKQKVKYPQDYTVVLLGDSMTQYLGNSDELRKYLKEYYPNKSFEFLNYGFGATNILSVQKRLEETTSNGRDFQPILDIYFDLILIESFGHNPLSQLPLEEGLQKQTEALDKAVKTIKEKSPNSKIVFVATIAPNKLKYGEGQVDLSTEERTKWADERNTYIKNHIKYATENNIPLVNIYEKSMDVNGNGKIDYINKLDYIHPSPDGVYFISREIADFIYRQKILEP